jgi:hypothetical protein
MQCISFSSVVSLPATAVRGAEPSAAASPDDPVCRGWDPRTVKLTSMRPLDLIEVNKGGRRVYGKVVEIRDGVVQFEPLCRGISYRHASAREIVGHWRKTGRRGQGPGDEADTSAAVPRSQLSLGIDP